MLNAIARITATTARKTKTYLKGDGNKNPGKVKEVCNTYKAAYMGLEAPDTKPKDVIDKELLEWARDNGWSKPNSTK